MTLISLGKQILLKCIYFFIGILHLSIMPLSQKTDDIVIIRLDHIGDFVLWLGAAKYLRKIYQDRKLTLICMACNQKLAEGTGYFDKVIACKNSIWSVLRAAFGIKANLLLNPTYSRDFLSEFTAALVAAPEKIAIDGDTANSSRIIRKTFDNSYTSFIETPKDTLMELVRNQYFVNGLGCGTFPVAMADLSYFLGSPSQYKETYFLVNLGASVQYRQWPVERFLHVAKFIYKETGWLCVLSGGTSETDLAKCFLDRYPYCIKNLVGKTSIPEVINLTGNAALVLCNDTSTVHIAAACNVQSFCIAPGVHYPRFVPYIVDDFSGNDTLRLPIVVMNKENCFGCGNSEKARKFRKAECQSAMKGTGLLHCIEHVSVAQVIEQVNAYLIKRKKECQSDK